MRNIVYYVLVVTAIGMWMGISLANLEAAYQRVDTVCQEGC